MKKIIVVAVIIASFVSNINASNIDFDKLINILIMVESKGNNYAIGDKGKAKGCLQIWKVVVTDVNSVYKTNYKHNDAFNKEKAKIICKLYLQHYGKIYKLNTGKEPTVEIYSRIWNGGPKGYTNKKTINYWDKVKKKYLWIK